MSKEQNMSLTARLTEVQSTAGIAGTKRIWRPSHHLKSNGQAKYILGLGMLPKLYKGRIHTLAKVTKVLK